MESSAKKPSTIVRWSAMACALVLACLATAASSAEEAPDAFVQRITNDTLNTIKADKALRSGDIQKVMQLVDSQLMQHVNFRRMTALATGPAWRSATPEQQNRLQDEFKTLLVRTYSGALSQITDQVVVVKPLRRGQDDKNLVVNTEVRGKGDAVQLDYRLEKTAGQGAGWMIFDLNVLGVWLVENYRNQFTKEINDYLGTEQNITYSAAVAIVGAASIDGIILVVAGADGNFVG